MSATILGFGHRHKKALPKIDADTCKRLASDLLDIAADAEAGKFSAVYVALVDIEGVKDSCWAYQPDAHNRILTEVNWMRKEIIRRIREDRNNS